ncbi:major facilitator superfamily domain-containing protein [Elsinoe ampelina]|uniref:Cercosporin MFS transporter CTB4 n=1 Tax=Elsinoe ampelina TaxID=302913 RepID=A0A6A6G458_9PEZI|nr:major facilitator superfamily domain-containing protein [Elsinoe ampelina]
MSEKEPDVENTPGTVEAMQKSTSTASSDGEPQQEQQDQYLVTWDGENDPTNPLNWSRGKKIIHIAMVSGLTFVTPLASSMFAPGVPYVLQRFQQSNEVLASFVVSVYLVGYAFGPLLCAPLCELYGRAIVYQVTNVLYLGFSIGCAAAPSFNSLIGLRFLAGAAGSAPLVLGGGTIADLYKREERGAKMSIFSMGPLMGPVIGPIAGAFVAQDVSWRWVFWIISIAAGVCTVFCLIFMRETYAPVLLDRKAKKVRAETGNPLYKTMYDTGDTPKDVFVKALSRPTLMFVKSPTVFIFTMYLSIIYGFTYLLFVTITQVFESTYGFSTGIAGLAFLGIGIGMFLGLAVFGATSDRRIRSLKAKAEAKGGTVNDVPPEVRLEGMIGAAVVIPIGLFWYGWSAEKEIHYIMPIIGTGLFGLGNIGIFIAVQTYLVDCYPLYAASVTSTHTVVRSLLGAFLPLAGRPLYRDLGLGWGNSLLGFVAVAMIPVPLVLLKYGGRVREKFQVKF